MENEVRKARDVFAQEAGAGQKSDSEYRDHLKLKQSLFMKICL
jgi:hypothetical protein